MPGILCPLPIAGSTLNADYSQLLLCQVPIKGILSWIVTPTITTQYVIEKMIEIYYHIIVEWRGNAFFYGSKTFFQWRLGPTICSNKLGCEDLNLTECPQLLIRVQESLEYQIIVINKGVVFKLNNFAIVFQFCSHQCMFNSANNDWSLSFSCISWLCNKNCINFGRSRQFIKHYFRQIQQITWWILKYKRFFQEILNKIKVQEKLHKL